MSMREDPNAQDYRDYLLLVGDIATHYASFENIINETIWMLAELGDDRRGACITTPITNIATKFKILFALMHEVEADKGNHDRAKKSLNVRTKRNAIPQ